MEPTQPTASFLDGGGEAARMIRERDWSGHPLGAPETWPEALRVALGLVLNSPESMILAWGPELHFFFNETYFPLLGPRLPWAMGAPFREVWADGWEQAQPIIAEAMAGRSTRYIDLPWKLGVDRGARDTWWTFSYSRVLDADGAPAGLFIFTNETTARVLADAALLKSQGELAASIAEVRGLNETLEKRVTERTEERDRVWRLSRDLFAIVGADGVFRAANPAWTTILGYEPREIVGRSFRDFVWPEDTASSQAALDRAADHSDLTGFENRYRHKHGEPRWISWHSSVEGHLVYAYGRDVTAEKKQAEALRRAEDALRQSQKMEAVGQLTGGLAHDFNNLLTGITGSLELLQTRVAQGRVGEIERYVLAAQGAARRAAALTHRLLAFSRRQTLDPKPTDANRLILDMEELIRRTIGPEIALDVTLAPDLWATLIDASQLENALLNLCLNARDAMPGGGRILIQTRNRPLDERVARDKDLPAGDYVLIAVTDTGEGMTPETAAKAFEPFFTTKPLGQGTGLGLSMTYGFVRQSGGQVRIDSAAGHGTTMRLYLPRHAAALPVDAAEGALHAEAATAVAGETVLVVDDEPMIRMLVADVLHDLGYVALEAADGAAGLAILQSGARIDLLVSDVGLPGGMNGRQMADAARIARPDLKVLFITGYAEKRALGDGQLARGMQVLTKPFVIETLAARIREMIAG